MTSDWIDVSEFGVGGPASGELGFTEASFAFLEALAAHNEKAWFDPRKADYKAQLHAPFARFLSAATAAMADGPFPLIGGEKTMFRLHRDVRFAKDKRPYKTNVSGLFTPDGTKNEAGLLAFAQADPSGGFLAAGIYRPDAKRLGALRARILADPGEVAHMEAALAAAGLAIQGGDALKTMPRGMAEHAAAPFAEQLRRKSWTVRRTLSRADWISGAATAKAANFVAEAAPLLQFLARA